MRRLAREPSSAATPAVAPSFIRLPPPPPSAPLSATAAAIVCSPRRALQSLASSALPESARPSALLSPCSACPPQSSTASSCARATRRSSSIPRLWSRAPTEPMRNSLSSTTRGHWLAQRLQPTGECAYVRSGSWQHADRLAQCVCILHFEGGRGLRDRGLVWRC